MLQPGALRADLFGRPERRGRDACAQNFCQVGRRNGVSDLLGRSCHNIQRYTPPILPSFLIEAMKSTTGSFFSIPSHKVRRTPRLGVSLASLMTTTNVYPVLAYL